jgi:hypothetical protein
MATSIGPKIVTSDITFHLDPASLKSVGPMGTSDVGLPSFKDFIRSQFLNTSADLKITDIDYFTMYALQFPEGNQTPANRQGITPGYKNITATKIYTGSRDFHAYAWLEETQDWLSSVWFNGTRMDGHCYDTYNSALTASEHSQFQADFKNIHQSYPNANWVIIGSHAAENSVRNPITLDILKRIGHPGDIPPSRPEFIIIGKVDKPSTWRYVLENVNAEVATMTVGFPLQGPSRKSLDFTTGDFISLPSNLGYTSEFSQFAWFKATGNPNGNYHIVFGTSNAEISVPVTGEIRVGVVTTTSNIRYVGNLGSGLVDGNWHYVGMTYRASDGFITGYIDGVAVGTVATDGGIPTPSFDRRIGQMGADTQYHINGKIGTATIYNRKLTNTEIQSNYTTTRIRYQ